MSQQLETGLLPGYSSEPNPSLPQRIQTHPSRPSPLASGVSMLELPPRSPSSSGPPSSPAPSLQTSLADSVYSGFTAQSARQGKYTESENEEAWSQIWSIYVGEAERYDSALVQSWRADMEGMLIFSGLFSASLTAFIIESYKRLQPDAGDLTVGALSQVSQQLAALAAGETIPLQTPSTPFHPALSSLLCNSLWFISLALSLTCALLATLVEQWARDFLHKTDMRRSPIRRARVSSLLYFGLKRFRMHTVVDTIPFLLHASLVLFFAGLVIFLVPVNRIVMYIMALASFVFVVLYAILTGLPVIHLDCPYHTPLSSLLWALLLEIRGQSLHSTTYDTGVKHTRTEGVLQRAMELPDDRDQRALRWTLESLTDDTELLPFIEAIPDAIFGPNGFRRTKDSLFLPLLGDWENPSPLVTRTCNLIASTRGLRPDDPLRARCQTAGFKCLWALAMMPVSWRMRFDTSSIDSFFVDKGTHPLRQTALLALQHHDLQWGFHLVRQLKDLLQDCDVHSEHFKNSTLPMARRLLHLILDLPNQKLLPHEDAALFKTSFKALNELQGQTWHTSSERAARISPALNSLVTTPEWTNLTVGIVISWLQSAFDLPFAPPFEPLATCNQIFAGVKLPDAPTPSSTFYLPNLAQVLESPSLQTKSGIHEVDILMRIAFRLLPFSSTATTRSYVNYLYHRNSKDAVPYVLRDCNTRRLTTSLCEQIQRHRRRQLEDSPLWTRLSHAIAVLISVYPLSDTLQFADKMVAVAKEDTQSLTPSDPSFRTVHAVRRLRGLEKLAQEIPSPDHYSVDHVQLLVEYRGRELLRPHCPLFIPESTDLPVMYDSLRTQIFNQYILSAAWFLDNCAAQHWTAQLAASAFDFLKTVRGFNTTTVWAGLDSKAQQQFFASVLRFIQHMVSNPAQLDQTLVGVAEAMWQSPIFLHTQPLPQGAGNAQPVVNARLCDLEPSCVDSLVEALRLYQTITSGTSRSVSNEVLTWITDPVVTAWAKSRRSRRDG
ncbi:hypothetical protein FB451DRAFT_1226612 [Mycena latifolia]|nr:hypothetical protein FB451DRAFT_1226612 [Mycena latifolia]